MKTAWIKTKNEEVEYDLPKLCCKKLEESHDIQLQDGKWLLFGNDMTVKPDIIKYCPFCSKRLKVLYYKGEDEK